MKVVVFIITGEGPPPPPPDAPPSPPGIEQPPFPGTPGPEPDPGTPAPEPDPGDSNGTTTYTGTVEWEFCALTAGAALVGAAGLITLNVLAPYVGVPVTASVILFIATPSVEDSGRNCCPDGI